MLNKLFEMAGNVVIRMPQFQFQLPPQYDQRHGAAVCKGMSPRSSRRRRAAPRACRLSQEHRDSQLGRACGRAADYSVSAMMPPPRPKIGAGPGGEAWAATAASQQQEALRAADAAARMQPDGAAAATGEPAADAGEHVHGVAAAAFRVDPQMTEAAAAAESPPTGFGGVEPAPSPRLPPPPMRRRRRAPLPSSKQPYEGLEAARMAAIGR